MKRRKVLGKERKAMGTKGGGRGEANHLQHTLRQQFPP